MSLSLSKLPPPPNHPPEARILKLTRVSLQFPLGMQGVLWGILKENTVLNKSRKQFKSTRHFREQFKFPINKN